MGTDTFDDGIDSVATPKRITFSDAGRPLNRHARALTGSSPSESNDQSVARAWIFKALIVVLFIGFTNEMVLRHYGVISRDPIWLYVAVLGVCGVTVAADPPWVQEKPRRGLLLAQMAILSVGITAAIYMTGWGPILITSFAVVSVATVVRYGTAFWKPLVAVQLLCVLLAQIGIALHLVPTELPVAKAEGAAAMGVLILLVIIRLTVYAADEIKKASQALESSEERFRSLVQHVSDTTMLISADGAEVVYVSPACHALLGCPPEELVGMDLLSLVDREDWERVALEVAEKIRVESVVHSEFRMSTLHDGEVRHVEAVISDMRENSAVNGFVINLRDISERKATEAQMEFAAFHDTLTGLANRALILDRTEQLLARSRRHNRDPAVLFVDLDNFKDVNDSLGHQAGDSLLLQVADRLTSAIRESDTVGRMGGDEFVVLLEGPLDADESQRIAGNLLNVLAQPVTVGADRDESIVVSASIGVATGRRNSADELIGDADIALYQAKGAGKHCSVVFDPNMALAMTGRLQNGLDLRRALDQHEFFLVYQPLFTLDPVTIYGVEALLRWQHPDRGTVPPNEFIPVLEENGLIRSVGRWVLLEACRQLAKWERDGLELAMSINVSMVQFESNQIVTDVTDAVLNTGCNPEHVVIEITETALMSDRTGIRKRLDSLKQLGVRIAIDDFGTGYASLEYLRDFPVDELKIDGTFIASIGDSHDANVIVRSLVDMGHALGIGTVAEGIEDHSQLNMLRDARCLHGQGFLISRPLPAEDLAAFLKDGHPKTGQFVHH